MAKLKDKLKRINFSYFPLVFGLMIMLVFIIFALFPNKIAPYGVTEAFEPFMECSKEHILGTNNIGRDIFTEMVYATGSTLTIGLLSALISLGIGVVVGLIAGYFEGFVGETVNGIINFFLLIPMLPLAIVLAAYLGAGQQNIILTISLLGWCGVARAVKSKTAKLRKMPFIESLKQLGVSKTKILFKHIVPNLKDVIFARYVTSVASCILLEATLSFLGLGDIHNVTWGQMINLAYSFGGFSMGLYNWLLAPGLCIVLLVLAFHSIGFFAENYRQNNISSNKSFID